MGRSTTITYTCDVCGVRLDEDHALSIIVHYAMPGPGISSLQCPQEQHYGCSPEHAIAAATTCMQEHLERQRQARAYAVAIAPKGLGN